MLSDRDPLPGWRWATRWGDGPARIQSGTARASQERGRSGSSRCYSLLCRRRRARAASIPPGGSPGTRHSGTSRLRIGRTEPTQGPAAVPTGAGGKTAPRQQAEEHSGCRAQQRDRSARGLLGHRHPRRPPESGGLADTRLAEDHQRRAVTVATRSRADRSTPNSWSRPTSTGHNSSGMHRACHQRNGTRFSSCSPGPPPSDGADHAPAFVGCLPPITGTSRIGLSAGAVGDDGLLHRTGEAVPQGTGGPPARCPRDGTSSTARSPNDAATFTARRSPVRTARAAVWGCLWSASDRSGRPRCSSAVAVSVCAVHAGCGRPGRVTGSGGAIGSPDARQRSSGRPVMTWPPSSSVMAWIWAAYSPGRRGRTAPATP